MAQSQSCLQQTGNPIAEGHRTQTMGATCTQSSAQECDERDTPIARMADR